jgi:ABC-type multidrug transport system ATPase subunit
LNVREYLKARAASSVTEQEILNMAGSFLFRGDDVDKRIAVLSGGERSRLCLAGLLLARSNVLLLDEPTNHLDFETVEALGAALAGYQGTMFFTSHDRTFVSLVATSIIEVRGGRVSLLEIVARLEAILGRALRRRHTPSRPGDVPHTLADVEKGKRLLGYAPLVGFDEGFRRTVEYFRTSYTG